MEIILLQRIENLGQMGDIVNVKPGYARNFLLPKKMALRASAANKKIFEGRRAQLEADNLHRKNEAEAAAKKMANLSLPIVRQASETGQLYGSVTSRDIALAMGEAGYKVARGQILLANPIKNIGTYDVRLALHPEVIITVKVSVAPSELEANAQSANAIAATEAAAAAAAASASSAA